jgi:hypothetical protein
MLPLLSSIPVKWSCKTPWPDIATIFGGSGLTVSALLLSNSSFGRRTLQDRTSPLLDEQLSMILVPIGSNMDLTSGVTLNAATLHDLSA